MARWLGRWLCRYGHHDWREEMHGRLVDGRMFRRVGDGVPCRRGCGAVLRASVPNVPPRSGWRVP